MTDIPTSLAKLSEKGRRLLAERIRSDASQPTGPSLCGNLNQFPNIPLSFGQERLWLLDQIEGARNPYNIPAAIRLYGNLAIGTLERALSQLIERHEILRTRFETVDGVPAQVIADPAPMPLQLLDLSHLTPEKREEESRRIIATEARTRLDPTRGQVLRARILRMDVGDHILVLISHHIVSDGWSIWIMFRDLLALYGGQVLPPLPLQYSDYSIWQRNWLSESRLESQLEYWCRYLANAPSGLNLPTDRPRPAVQGIQGASLPIAVPLRLLDRLRALARSRGATLFMVLLAAYAVVLSRWCRQKDIVIGTPIAGRTQPELENLIGFFVNMLALRIDLSGNPGVGTLIERVREAAVRAFTNQDLPFAKLVAALQPVRDLSRASCLSSLFRSTEFSPKRCQNGRFHRRKAPSFL